MDYQNYEEYMRSVLGYQPMTNNLYNNQIPDYTYNMPQPNTEYLNQYYPEIYKMIYPMVCKVCNRNPHREISKEILDSMVNEIYENIEADNRSSSNQNQQLKNGDVRNPNVKEIETRQHNYMLRDLITILLLRELGRPTRPPMRPPIPPPGPGIRPPFNMRNYYY